MIEGVKKGRKEEEEGFEKGERLVRVEGEKIKNLEDVKRIV